MHTDSVHLEVERPSLLASALRVSYFTIVWNGVVGAAALLAGVTTGSLALAAFALNALLDSTASVVLVWRFRRERSDPVAAERLERHAQTWVIAAMFAVALYVGVQAIRALINGSHPEPSAFGFGIATASLLVLPALAVMKLRLGGQLKSPALRGDGVLTVAAAALAAVTLLALAATSLLDWWWADRQRHLSSPLRWPQRRRAFLSVTASDRHAHELCAEGESAPTTRHSSGADAGYHHTRAMRLASNRPSGLMAST